MVHIRCIQNSFRFNKYDTIYMYDSLYALTVIRNKCFFIVFIFLVNASITPLHIVSPNIFFFPIMYQFENMEN